MEHLDYARARTYPVQSGGIRSIANGAAGLFWLAEWAASRRTAQAWLAAPDVSVQKAICAEIQRQAFVDLPMIPLGQYFQPTAYRTSLRGVLSGFQRFGTSRARDWQAEGNDLGPTAARPSNASPEPRACPGHVR
jgi:hypothetical protein